MADPALCYMPATEMARLIAAKTLSPVEVMEATLARVEAMEPSINAFATFRPEPALAAAREAEAAVARGDPLAPLHGVPVTIKDLAETEAVPTMKGSYIPEHNVPNFSTALVTRLEQAGAISLGKTTTSEFGWKAVSHSPLTGITSNPWRLGYNAGALARLLVAGAGRMRSGGRGCFPRGLPKSRSF